MVCRACASNAVKADPLELVDLVCAAEVGTGLAGVADALTDNNRKGGQHLCQVSRVGVDKLMQSSSHTKNTPMTAVSASAATRTGVL